MTPNLSNNVRKVFYVGYHYRWLRPTDYLQQDPELIAAQLARSPPAAGALATGTAIRWATTPILGAFVRGTG